MLKRRSSKIFKKTAFIGALNAIFIDALKADLLGFFEELFLSFYKDFLFKI